MIGVWLQNQLHSGFEEFYLEDSDMALWAKNEGCAKFFGYDSTALDDDLETCLKAVKKEPMKDKVLALITVKGCQKLRQHKVA